MTEFSIMRVPIGGEWWAFEMAGFIDAIDELYADVALISVARELSELAAQHPSESLLLRTRAELLRSITLRGAGASSEFLRGDAFEIENTYNLARTAPLQVLSVKYGSDGEFEFFGIGKMAQAVASMYNKTVDWITGKPARDRETLENIKTKLDLAKFAGWSDVQLEAYAVELMAKHDSTFRKVAKQNPPRLPKPMTLLPAAATTEQQRKPPDYG